VSRLGDWNRFSFLMPPVLIRKHPRPRRFAIPLLFVVMCMCVAPTGCRRPRVGQPLGPGLPGPVNDLAAVLAGDNLSLIWTMPKGKSAKLVVNGRISVRVCRRASGMGPCTEIGEPILLVPGAPGSFSEQLPPALTSGSPRVLYYFVELLDRNGRSTGLSNSVATMAGAPLPAVQNLAANFTKDGVLLRWTGPSAAEDPSGTIIRLHCTQVLRGPPQDVATNNPDPDEHDLWVKDEVPSGPTLDKNVHPGDIYEYTAQRVVRVTVGRQQLELAGQLSAPVRVDTGGGVSQ
jgi:hypothetical protein